MLNHSFKNTAFSEKIVKNHLWENMAVLRDRGRLVTKINITFFVENEVLHIFHRTIKQKTYSKITMKKNFWET